MLRIKTLRAKETSQNLLHGLLLRYAPLHFSQRRKTFGFSSDSARGAVFTSEKSMGCFSQDSLS